MSGIAVRVGPGWTVPEGTGPVWTEEVPARTAARLDRETARPGSRTVLLRYADGTADLVVTGPAPARAAADLLGRPRPDGEIPDLRALALVLAQRADTDRVLIGTPAGPVAVTVDLAAPVADLVPVPAVGEPAVGVVDADPPALDGVVAYRPGEPWATTVAIGRSAVRCRDEVLARQVGFVRSWLASADPATPQGAVPLVEPAAPVAPPAVDGRRIERVVADRAAAHPDRVAVRCGDDEVTYAELVARADAVAAGLHAKGVRAGDRVGVCLDRSVRLVVTLLGVLRAGATYVPMDPHHPEGRREFTARDAGVVLVVEEGTELPAGERCPLSTDAGLPAYVIYTSGSTGTPKGVLVPHRNVLALLAATADRFGLGGDDRWTMFHSAAFDFSVWETWCCLMTGGRLVVVPYWVSRSPEQVAELVAAEGITVLSQTPSAFGQLLAVDERVPLPRVPRLVVFGGEPLDPRPLLGWFDRHGTATRLVNMYGITETTVHVTAQELDRGAALAGTRSVGRPLAGWTVEVRDRHGRALPPGVAGEIVVSGAGVAAGYLDRPELTAERFAGGTYRSGDRGRLLPDGRLEHLGRLDDQVQLRGFRVELGEVRAQLLGAPGVAAAAVVVRESAAGGPRLDGYLVFRAGGGDTGGDTERVRRHVARFLPEHMVPGTLTELPALPLTGNGKLDASRLPDPAARPARTGAGHGTDDPVCSAWEAVFGVEIRPEDDFFRLGGNSLLAVRLVAALRDRGLPAVSLPELYRNPTVAGLTELVGSGR